MSRLLIALTATCLLVVAAASTVYAAQTGDAQPEAAPADEAQTDTAQASPAASTADPAAEVAQIMAGVEGLVTQLATAQDLNAQEVEALRKSLATVYSQLEDLSGVLANMQVTPPADPSQWQPYADASVKLEPPDAKFSGWNVDSGIDLGWGQYGEVTLDIQNSAYRAQWTIENAYHGEVKANVVASPDGNVVLTIKDTQGTREFRIENGGVGPISMRLPEAGAPDETEDGGNAAGTETTPEVKEEAQEEPAWTAQYRAAVAAGQMENAPTMDWFIKQTMTRDYETDALRDLGDAVMSLSGQPMWDKPLGTMAYYVNDERKEMQIPDPRSYPEGFTHVINKMYILTLSEQVYSVEIN